MTQKSQSILIKGLKSKIITPEDNLFEVLQKSLKKSGELKDGDVIVITSKVVAITQGRVIKIKNKKQFNALVRKEADKFYDHTLTLKDGIFIAWAGIDRSNIPNGYGVLWPKKPFKVAEEIQKKLRKAWKLKKIGVMITDSCCVPLRRGVHAVTLGYFGYEGVEDLRGKKDIYGKKLKVTQRAVADNLANAAQLIMGESRERMPFAIISNAPVQWSNKKVPKKCLLIDAKKCLFAPMYRS